MPRPAKFDDAELLDRSVDLLWRDGCDAVTIRDLEAALDIRAPSIYRRFHSRDDLIASSVDRYVDRVVRSRIGTHLEGAADPIDGLRAFFVADASPRPGEDRPRGCLLTVTAGQHAYDHPRTRTAVSTGLIVVETAFRDQLERARSEGLLTDDADLDTVAAALLVAFEGLLVLARAGRGDLDALVDALLTGLLPLSGRSRAH